MRSLDILRQLGKVLIIHEDNLFIVRFIARRGKPLIASGTARLLQEAAYLCVLNLQTEIGREIEKKENV